MEAWEKLVNIAEARGWHSLIGGYYVTIIIRYCSSCFLSIKKLKRLFHKILSFSIYPTDLISLWINTCDSAAKLKKKIIAGDKSAVKGIMIKNHCKTL